MVKWVVKEDDFKLEDATPFLGSSGCCEVKVLKSSLGLKGTLSVYSHKLHVKSTR